MSRIKIPRILKDLSKRWQFWVSIVLLSIVVIPVIVGAFITFKVNPYSEAGHYVAAPYAIPSWATIFYGNLPPDINVPSSYSLIAAKSPAVISYWHLQNETINNDTVIVLWDSSFGPTNESNYEPEGFTYGNTGDGSIEIIIKGDNPVNITLYHTFDYDYKLPTVNNFYSMQMSIYYSNDTTAGFIINGYLTNPDHYTVFLFSHGNTYPLNAFQSNYVDYYFNPVNQYMLSPNSWNYEMIQTNAPSFTPYYYSLPLNESSLAAFDLIKDVFNTTGIYNVSFVIEYIPSGVNSSLTLYLSDIHFEFLGSVYGLLGTDNNGASVFAEFVQGGIFDLELALITGLVIVGIGAILGILAAYYGRIFDYILVALTDFFLLLPGLVFLIIFETFLGLYFPSLMAKYRPEIIAGIIALLAWPPTARVLRGETFVVKSQQFIEAAKVLGLSNFQILRKHILPHLMPIIFAQLIFDIPAVIYIESTLDFLGLGITSFPTWGNMLGFATDYIVGAPYYAWWWWIPPFIALTLIGISLFYLGESVLERYRRTGGLH